MAAHAKLSASGSKKWATCTMSPAMEAGIEDEDSDYSRQGTCAHAVAETRLRNWLAEGPHDDESLVPDYSEFFNAEFSDHVDEFVEYAKKRVEAEWKKHGRGHVVVLLEQRLDFSEWVPEGFGTGDVVVISPGLVIVIDLKFGAGYRVDVKGNGQLRLYGLGAYHQYHVLYDFTEVEVVIHQPRMNNVASEVLHVSGPGGLLTWAEELVRPRAAIAWAALHGDYSNARFSPGDHCHEAFCKARFTCAARARKAMELAEMDDALAEPDTLTIDQLEDVYARTATAVKWASDVKNYLVKSAARGSIELHRYELVEGRSVRVIKDTTRAAQVLMHNGFKASDIYKEPELYGLTQLEKLVGAKKLTELLGDLLEKPTGAPTLAPRGSGKNSVEPARPKLPAQQAFGDLD